MRSFVCCIHDNNDDDEKATGNTISRPCNTALLLEENANNAYLENT